MPDILTVKEIQSMASNNGLDVTAQYPKVSVTCDEVPRPVSLTVWFRKESVDVWEKLMSSLTEVPVKIRGTRQMTGSGATDDLLYPAYAARLDVVNSVRASIGLERIFR